MTERRGRRVRRCASLCVAVRRCASTLSHDPRRQRNFIPHVAGQVLYEANSEGRLASVDSEVAPRVHTCHAEVAEPRRVEAALFQPCTGCAGRDVDSASLRVCSFLRNTLRGVASSSGGSRRSVVDLVVVIHARTIVDLARVWAGGLAFAWQVAVGVIVCVHRDGLGNLQIHAVAVAGSQCMRRRLDRLPFTQSPHLASALVAVLMPDEHEIDSVFPQEGVQPGSQS